jgi:N-acyl homoserine lactone hydrolase
MILPGHRLHRLFVLDFGLFDVGPGLRTIGIPGFLLETRDDEGGGARILFDTGFPPAYATHPDETAARDGLHRFGAFARFGANTTAAGQLALLDLAPGDISHVILSHGHIDHVGSLPLFAHARIILTARERADPQPCYFFDMRPMDWPTADYLTLTEDTDLCEGLRLIPTPGHTLGHLSALATLPDGRAFLLAADAINRISEPDEGFADAKDPATALQSFRKLEALAHATGATMIYGHEPSQWPALPKAPWPLA